MDAKNVAARIKGLIFDMDGLLVDTEDLHVLAWKELFSEEGITVSPEVFMNNVGVADNIFLEELEKDGLIPRFSDKELLINKKTSKLINLAGRGKIGVFPGAHDAVMFGRRYFEIALASNSDRGFVEAVLDKTGFGEIFRLIITGTQVLRPKPSPDIYIAAAKHMGIVAGECAVFEDSPVGVKAAKAAGMLCVAIKNTSSEERLKGADYICNELSPCVIKDILLPFAVP